MPNTILRPFAIIWAFPQLRNVFLLVLAIVLAVPTLAMLWVFPSFTALLVANTEEEVTRDATILAADITRDIDALTPDRLSRSPRVAELLGQGVDRLGGEKLRLFSADATIVFSTEPAEVGRAHGGPVFREVVARGKPFSKLEREGETTTDGVRVDRAIVETYVPIMRDGHFIGAFEVYTDVTERASLQGRLLQRIGLVLLAIGAGLAAFLVFILHKAGRALALKEQAEAKIRETATVFEVSSDAIFITDAGAIIRRVNPAFSEITGYAPDEVVGKTPRVLKSGRHDAGFYESFWASLKQAGHWEGEIFNRRKDGTIYPQWETVTALKGPGNEIVGYMSQFSDVARRKLTEEEIRYRANYDALTGLPNRGLLVERLERAILEAERDGKGVAVMFVDLDHFKQINDTQGHLAGDKLLQEAAAFLKSCVRAMDTVARQGGDEFVVVLPGIDTGDHAVEVAGKIVERFRAGIQLQGRNAHVTASVGVAIYPEDGKDVYTLFRNADMAMYRTKEQGRDNVQFYEPAMTEMALYRHRLESDLRQALARGELAMHYQPIVDLAEGRLAGVEALMRWQHPERGAVPPDRFIPLAEDIGLISELGDWALETVSEQLARWRADGLDLYAAVNLSGRQIPDAVTPDHLSALIERHGLVAADLLLEITEGVLLKDAEKAQAWVAAVRGRGFRVALDDFGTGYSSLSYLKRLDLDVVKIDKSFVSDMEVDASDRALVKTIVTLGHLLGLKIVAEGIENAAQLEQLKAMGCEYAQGYLLSRPVPAEAIPALRLSISQAIAAK
jgi:diguanylate cyclase (GGDEF)-like protein/PAS domain S-box-containing protein